VRWGSGEEVRRVGKSLLVMIKNGIIFIDVIRIICVIIIMLFELFYTKRYVIDCGFEKRKLYDPFTRIYTLKVFLFFFFFFFFWDFYLFFLFIFFFVLWRNNLFRRHRRTSVLVEQDVLGKARYFVYTLFFILFFFFFFFSFFFCLFVCLYYLYVINYD
jgi:hypothetical protein